MLKNYIYILAGILMIISGVVLFITDGNSKNGVLYSGGLFVSGAYLIGRVLGNIKNRPRKFIDIKNQVKDRYLEEE